MRGVRFPDGWTLERLEARHPRRQFSSGEAAVDEWLRTKALQAQEKNLSVTRVLLDEHGRIVGFFTLATGQVDFVDLPADLARKLPRRMLPVAVLSWLGTALEHQRRGVGSLLLAQALRECFEAGQIFPFIAVLLDCVSDPAKRFYLRWNFEEVPGHPSRLYLSWRRLERMMEP